MRRRELLATVGAGTAIGLAGCTSVLDGEHGVELLGLGVVNWADETATIEVRLERDDEILEEATYELESGEGESFDCTWPSGPAEFVVSTRTPGEEDWDAHDLTDRGSECIRSYVVIEDEGVTILSNTDCDPPEETC